MRNKFNKVFLHKLHLKCMKMSKERLLMTIITLHHLFFGHCVNSSVVLFGPWYFSSSGKKKNDGPQLLFR